MAERLKVRVVLDEGQGALRSRLDLKAIRLLARRAALGRGLGNGHINVVLTGSDEMRRLNRAHRGVDATADVLSFDLRDVSEKSIVGEVYISVPCARDRASKRKRALRKEVFHLTVHGILHLAGFDHQTQEEWGEMERETRRCISTHDP